MVKHPAGVPKFTLDEAPEGSSGPYTSGTQSAWCACLCQESTIGEGLSFSTPAIGSVHSHQPKDTTVSDLLSPLGTFPLRNRWAIRGDP